MAIAGSPKTLPPSYFAQVFQTHTNRQPSNTWIISQPLPSDIRPVTTDDTNVKSLHANITSFTGLLSTISDTDLDELIINFIFIFCQTGITMLDGMLHRSGQRVPCEHIRASLIHVDHVQCVFQHMWIWQWVYSVPGPMALWHHNG